MFLGADMDQMVASTLYFSSLRPPISDQDRASMNRLGKRCFAFSSLGKSNISDILAKI